MLLLLMLLLLLIGCILRETLQLNARLPLDDNVLSQRLVAHLFGSFAYNLHDNIAPRCLSESANHRIDRETGSWIFHNH